MSNNLRNILLSTLSLIANASLAGERDGAKPNLVFIFDDQHSFDMLGCNGNKQVKTPNLDKFAQQGVRFVNCFSNCPVCTPYRGMLMSGQHSLNNGTIKNDFPLLPGHGKKFAEVLRDSGYGTAYIGKWHIMGGARNRPIPKGDLRYGFDDLFLSNNCTTNFRPGHCFYWNEKGEKVCFDKWEVDGQTDQALEYLESRKDSKQPFALFLSWHAPHNNSEIIAANGEKHYTYVDVPDDLLALYHEDSIKVRPGTKNTPEIRKMYRGHFAMISGVDRAFGDLMEKLNDLGLDKNTLVVFTSDHGDMLEFLNYYGSKSVAYDYSDHTPLIMRWPEKLEANSSTKLMIGALDLMPSILGLMDLKVPKECQGKNLANAMVTKDENAVEGIPVWNMAGIGYRGVITRDYIFCRQKKEGKASFQNILIDRKADPFQLNNLFDNPTMADVKEKLWEITQTSMESFGDKFREWKDVMNAAELKDWENNTTKRPIDILR
jgi:arylsulfatase A-like enzyme